MRPKRLLFWIILLAFAGLTVWWAGYYPYDRARVCAAIPPTATFISEHQRLAERWHEVARNPVVQCALRASGRTAEEAQQAAADPDLVNLVARFGRRCTLIARVPEPGSADRPAWVVSTWAGAQGQLARLLLDLGLIKGFRRQAVPGGRHVWAKSASRKRATPYWSVAVSEGVLVACLSDDPAGVERIRDRVSRGAPVALRLRRPPDDGHAVTGEVQDRLWLDGEDVPGLGGTGDIRCTFDLLTGERTAGWVYSAARLPGTNVLGRAGFAEVGALLGDSPDAFVAMPFRALDAALDGAGPWPEAEVFLRVLREDAAEGSPAFACLLKHAYSGRVLGLKVPSLMVGLRVKDAGAVLDRLAGAADEMNAAHRTGFILTRTDVGGFKALAIGATRDDIFASLKPGERPVIVLAGDWLILASNTDVVTKLIEGRAGSEGSDCRWKQGLGRAEEASAHAWVDLAAANQAIRNAIAVYSLSLMARGREGDAEQIARLNNLRDWIETMGGLRNGLIWVRPKADGTSVQFDFGGTGVAGGPAQHP